MEFLYYMLLPKDHYSLSKCLVKWQLFKRTLLLPKGLNMTACVHTPWVLFSSINKHLMSVPYVSPHPPSNMPLESFRSVFPSKTVELSIINKIISHGSYWYSGPNINVSWLCYIPAMGIISDKIIYKITFLDDKGHLYTDPCLSVPPGSSFVPSDTELSTMMSPFQYCTASIFLFLPKISLPFLVQLVVWLREPVQSLCAPLCHMPAVKQAHLF